MVAARGQIKNRDIVDVEASDKTTASKYREGLGVPHPKFEPRVKEEERAEELGLDHSTKIMMEMQEHLLEGATNIDQDYIREKKKEFLRAIKATDPDLYESMRENIRLGKKGIMTKEEFENLPVDQLAMAKAIAMLQAPKSEQGFDYSSGVGSVTNNGIKFKRWILSMLDTNTEKEDYLNGTVGYDGWTTDSFGRYALTQKGLDILGLTALAPDEKGRIIDELGGMTRWDWVDAFPHIIQMAPAIAASIFLAPYGTIVGLLGGGISFAGGYLADEALEYAQGWSNQSAESIARMAAEEAVWGTATEGFIRMLRPIGRMITDPHGGGFFGFKLRPNAPYTRAQVLTRYPNLVNDVRVLYGKRADGTLLPDVEIQKLVNVAIKKLRFKTPLTGDPTVPGQAGVDPFNPNTRVISNIKDRHRKIIKDILEGSLTGGEYKAVPGLDQAINRPLIQRFAGMLDRIFNRPRDEANMRYLNHVALMLRAKAAGVPDDFLKTRAAMLGSEGELQALKEIQQAILQRGHGGAKSYEDTMNMILKNIETETDEAISIIRSRLGFLPEADATALATRLKQLKWSSDESLLSYGNELDTQMHGFKMFETKNMKQLIQGLKEIVPKTKVPRVTSEEVGPGLGRRQKTIFETTYNNKLPFVEQVAKLIEGIEAMPARVGASELLYLEKLFKAMRPEIAGQSGLISPKLIDDILRSIDHSFINGKGVLDSHVKSLKLNDRAAMNKAYAILKNLNKGRTEIQRKFDDVFVASAIKKAESGAEGFLMSKDILEYFVNQGRDKAFKSLLHALPESEREIFKASIKRATFDDVLEKSLNHITKSHEGFGFLNTWNNLNSGIKNTLFGKDQAAKITKLAEAIAAKNGKFTDKEIQALLNSEESNLVRLLNQKYTELAKQDEIFSQSWLKKLLRDDAELEKVIDYIFRPKSSNQILKAKEFLGAGDGGVWNKVKEGSMLQLLQKVATQEPGKDAIFNGPAFQRALDHYGKQTLDAMFGKTLRKDLYKFAEQITVLTSMNQSGGIVAANVALAPIRQGPKALFNPLFPFKIFSYLFSKPGFVEYMTFGMKSPWTRKGMEALARVHAYASSSEVLEKLAGGDTRQIETKIIDQGKIEKIRKDVLGTTVWPTKEEIPGPQSKMEMPPVNGASRLAGAFSPKIDPNRAAIAFGPNDILAQQQPRSAAQGGIMSTSKAFQRVA
jgi:hypothetical protein